MRQEIGAFAAPTWLPARDLEGSEGPMRGRTVRSHRRSQCCIAEILAKFSASFPCTAAVVLSHLLCLCRSRQRRRASAVPGLVEVMALSTLSAADISFLQREREGEASCVVCIASQPAVACWSNMNILLFFFFLFKSRAIQCDSLTVLEMRVLCSHGLWVLQKHTQAEIHTHPHTHIHTHACTYTEIHRHTCTHTQINMHPH